jgi:hypothetical protein
MCILHAQEVVAHGFNWITVLALGGAMYIAGVTLIAKYLERKAVTA